MPSSISSSNHRLPAARWGRVLLGALALLVGYVVLTEARLAGAGFQPTVLDTQARWLNERERASRVGQRGLIIVGASRVQLGLDLDVLRRETGLEPVQLAIDGSSFIPVFLGLAEDPAITGTVLVDFQYPLAADVGSSDRYQRAYEVLVNRSIDLNYEWIEGGLSDLLNRHLRSYADNAKPWDSLLSRILNPAASPQYLVTYPDRSRAADYSKVDMPEFYLRRVQNNLSMRMNMPGPDGAKEWEYRLQSHIARLEPSAREPFHQAISQLEAAVRAIQSRGGKVIFLHMPTSGLIREIERKRYPRSLFWDPFSRGTSARTLHSEDVPELARFKCPDGSHLDYRDRPAFTRALVRALGLSNPSASM